MRLSALRVPAMTTGPSGAIATLGRLPEGRAGVVQTLKLMKALAQDAKKTLPIRELAAGMVQLLPPKAYRAEAEVLFTYVRDEIRYTRDINDVETIQTPLRTVQYGYGDCDDKVTLLSALLESIGHPTRFVAIGIQGGPLSHVYLETLIGASWVGADPTEPQPFGWAPRAGVTSRYVLE